MKLFKMMGMIVLGVVALCAREAKESEQPIVVVCVDQRESGEPERINQAMTIAERMYSRIGIKLRWKSATACPDSGIRVDLTSHTPVHYNPGALAVAFPYEGTHIRLFIDRIGQVQAKTRSFLMGHVLAHEIAHILEGVSRHSADGIMKANFDDHDCSIMQFVDLPFDPYDVGLIRTGIARRTRVLEARR
jgi:hypothetical protein